MRVGLSDVFINININININKSPFHPLYLLFP